MLAQLFFTPSGIILDLAGASAATGVPRLSVAAAAAAVGFESQLLSPIGAGVSDAVDSSVETGVSQADESAVGVETAFSLCEPLVCATDAPRPLAPLPRSVPRPRPPLPPSKPARPPRETLDWLVVSPNEVTVASLALDRDRSFLVFETSPHCEIVPVVTMVSN